MELNEWLAIIGAIGILEKTSCRKQEEWMICNYDNVQGKQGTLFE